jgi:hypothetical protein
MHNLRISKYIDVAVDRSARDIFSFKSIQPMDRCSLGQDFLQFAHKVNSVGNATVGAEETCILRKVRPTNSLAQALPLQIVANGDDNAPIGRRKNLVRDQIRVLVAVPRRDVAACEIIDGLIASQRDNAIDKRCVDMLPATACCAMIERCQCGDCGVHARDDIHHRNPNFERAGSRLSVGNPGNAHQAAETLQHKVVPRLARIRAASCPYAVIEQ